MKRIAGVLLALLALPTVANAAFPGRNGAIVYHRWSERIVYDEESGDVFDQYDSIGVHAGTGPERVLATCAPPVACGPSTYGEPAVSPDGRLVALRAGEGLVLVDVHGGELREVPHSGASWGAPAFSPGGRRLVLESSSDGLAPSMWISDLDGGRAHRVVRAGRNPAWSSRNWIAFEDEDGGISRVRPDGRGLRSLVARGEQPAWAPGGRRVAFVLTRGRRHGVYTMDGDGRGVRRIPFDGLAYDVAWSPDGRKLLVAGETARGGPGLAIVDLRSGIARAVHVPRVADIETFTEVDWQPLP